MKGVKKNGKPAWKDILSPAYHAVRKLWWTVLELIGQM
jgi:hypothetical protein